MANVWNLLFSNVKKEGLLNVSNFVVILLTFIFFGLFINIVVYSQTAIRYLEDQAQITIFFKDDFSEESILALQKRLSADNRVMDAVYISKNDAYKIFKEISKSSPDIVNSTSATILPASIRVRAKNISDLAVLSAEYSKIDGVEEIRFFEDIIKQFVGWSIVVYVIGFFLVAAFMLISYSVIVAVLRTTISSRGAEYEIMKLVGATDTYIKAPLIYHGVVHGVSASIFASIPMAFMNVAVRQSGLFPKGLGLGFIHGVFIDPLIYTVILTAIMIGSGYILGYFGSSNAVKKYLKY